MSMKTILCITESNVKSIIDDVKQVSDTCISFDESLSDEALREVIDAISKFENENAISVSYGIKQLPFDLRKRVVKAFLSNDSFQNDSAVLNVINLIKNYNSLSEDFFKSDNIWFNSVTEFLDIKLELKKELNEFITSLTVWYLSLFQSVHKMEPNFLDKIVDIPDCFKKIFTTFDIFTLSGIIAKSAKFSTDQLKIVNDALPIANALMMKSTMSNQILNNILDAFKLCDQQI